MMNKKGVSIFRILLICLLFSFIIWVFVLTYQEIKKKNQQNDIFINDNLRLLDDNSQFNPYDFMYSSYLLAYKDSNFITSSSFNSPLNFESNSNIYFLYEDSFYGGDIGLSNITDSSHYPLAFDLPISNNSLDLSMLLNDLRFYTYYFTDSSNTSYYWNNGTASFALAVNCDIPINFFNFTFNYYFPISTSKTFYFFILTDSGSYRYSFSMNTSTLVNSFNGSSILSSLPSATKVLRFGFAIAQTSSSSNNLNYLPQSDTTISSTTGFNYAKSNSFRDYLAINYPSRKIYLSFSSSAYSHDFTEGYTSGYDDASSYYNSIINSLNFNITQLQSDISSLNQTINNQSLIISNLQNQLNQTQSNFKDLFFTFADVPIKTIQNILNFDFFGINLFRFFTGVLTALGAIWLIKKFI